MHVIRKLKGTEYQLVVIIKNRNIRNFKFIAWKMVRKVDY